MTIPRQLLEEAAGSPPVPPDPTVVMARGRRLQRNARLQTVAAGLALVLAAVAVIGTAGSDNAGVRTVGVADGDSSGPDSNDGDGPNGDDPAVSAWVGGTEEATSKAPLPQRPAAVNDGPMPGSPAGPGPWVPPSAGTIAYLSSNQGRLDLRSVNKDGTNPVTLAGAAPKEVDGFSWSPDGKAIAVTVYEGDGDANNANLYVVDLRTGGLVRLTDESDLQARTPAWSPDGKRILFYKARSSGPYVSTGATTGEGWWVIDADGTDARRLGGNGTDPSWAPDNRRFVYLNESRLWVMDVETGTTAPMTAVDSALRYPRWSPDGAWIAARKGNVVAVVRPSGEDFHTLLDGCGAGESCAVTQPSWSPDGGWIVTNDKLGDLVVVRPDGSSLRRVGSARGRMPAFTSDGRHLVYADSGPYESASRSLCDDNSCYAHRGVAIVALDGSGHRRLIDGIAYFPAAAPR